jgi:hypothetical protein
LAVLTPARDAGHRKQFAAELPGQIARRDHHQLNKALEPLSQLRPIEELEMLSIVILGISHVRLPLRRNGRTPKAVSVDRFDAA